MKKDITMRVASTRILSNGSAVLKVTPADGALLPEIMPGQFVNIKVSDTNGVFLRRPISVCDVEGALLTLFIKPVGKGSRRLTASQPGECFDVLLPLGNHFTEFEGTGPHLLIGGGVGIAPLLYLGRKLREHGKEPVFLLGGASASDLELVPEFSRFGNVYATTIDGSAGTRGVVTDHAVMQQPAAGIYCCGPTPMMKAVAEIAHKNGTPMLTSLENRMACGLGACLCCVENTKDGHRCVCTDGPVFNINELKW